jgi:hypothetical protein
MYSHIFAAYSVQLFAPCMLPRNCGGSFFHFEGSTTRESIPLEHYMNRPIKPAYRG